MKLKFLYPNYYIFLFSLFFSLAVNNSNAQIIVTLAGNGTAGYSGDGGAASSAKIFLAASSSYYFGLTADRAGNIYFPDYNCIRKVSVSGVITTIADVDTTVGFSGDGGPATAAHMNDVRSLTIDTFGNLYLADAGNFRIRKITPAGVISTIAGDGTYSYSGDGGPATAAEFHAISAIYIDKNGNLLIGDQFDGSIRKINSAGIITKVAGNGTWGYSGDGGAATNAEMKDPYGIVEDSSGNIFIADWDDARIRKITPAGTISTIAGNGTWGDSGDGGSAAASELHVPTALTYDTHGNLFIDDWGNERIRKINAAGNITSVAGSGTWGTTGYSGDGGPATAAEFNYPEGMAMDTIGNIYVADVENKRIRMVCPNPRAGAISGPSLVCAGATISLLDTGASTYGSWSVSSGTSCTISNEGVVTGISRGSATVAYTVVNRCGVSVFSTHTVTIDSVPFADSITGVSIVCPATSVVLSDASSGGTWNSSAASIATINIYGYLTGVSAGSATISYTITNTCGTSMATHSVTVPPVPHAGAIIGSPGVCLGYTTVWVDTPAGGTWHSYNTSIATVTSIAGIISGIGAGVDTLSYSITNSCGTASEIRTITIVAPPSVPDSIYGLFSICRGASATMTDATSTGRWSSSNPSLATIDGSAGIITGEAAGSAIITYSVNNSCGSSYITHPVAVEGPPSAGVISGMPYVCVGSHITLADATSGGRWSCDSPSIALIDSGTGILSTISAGTVLITYSVSGLCGEGNSTFYVEVDPLPNAGIITGPDTVCEGTRANLVSSAIGTYWISSDISIATISYTSGVVGGTSPGYVDIYNIFFNICGTDTTHFELFVSPSIPDPGVIAGANTLCAEDTTRLSDFEFPGSGNWESSNTSVCTVSSSGLVTGISEGVSLISYTVHNICGNSATASLPFTVFSLASCEDKVTNVNAAGNGLLLYPNPNNGNFTVTVGNETGREDATEYFEIYDIRGQLIYKSSSQAVNILMNKQISLNPNTPDGTYFLRMYTLAENQLIQFKIQRAD